MTWYRIILLKLLIISFVFLSENLWCQISTPKVQVPSDLDHEFDNGSQITNIPLTPGKIEDLKLLGKLWGFLKYYHPAIAEGKHNWDYELFRILPKIIGNKSQIDRNSILLSWVTELGNVEEGYQEKLDSSRVKLYPNISWISEENVLGIKLSAKLEKIKSASRQMGNYYVSLTPFVQNPDFSNEKPYDQMQFPDVGFRLLALYRYWNIIEYYNPNRHLIGKNWDSVLYEFIPRFVNVSNTLEYKLCALNLISCINDTHADIYGDPDIEKFKGMNTAQYIVGFIENKAVIIDYVVNNNIFDSTLQKGDVILNIDSVDIETIIKRKLPSTSGSNYAAQLRKISSDLLRTNDLSLNIVYQRGDVIKNVAISTKITKKIADNYFKRKQLDSCYRLIRPQIGYIYPGNIKKIYIDSIMDKFSSTKGIIIDLRYYPQESIINALGQYLLPKPVAFEISSTGSLGTPGLFMYKQQPNLVGGNGTGVLYKGKIILLVNENTQSHAEFTAMAFSRYDQTIIVGSTTAGADGNISWFYLPGGIKTLISGIGIYYPDGKETQRVGILANVHVKPTIKGVKEGHDELLEKALEILNTK